MTGILFLLAGVCLLAFIASFLVPDVRVVRDNRVKSIVLSIVFSIVALCWKGFFYAEPGYVYHVRTITGVEEVVSTPGYKLYPGGRYNAWKKAMTVQSLENIRGENMSSEDESKRSSASLPALNIMFLDNVDADASATVRFMMPSDRESFLRIAREYRSPENLLRTALIPSFKETLQATASLMSAEEYYSGGRTQFNSEFEAQMENGIYVVKREEKEVGAKKGNGTANAALEEQDEYDGGSKTVFVVTKVLDDNNMPKLKNQSFTDYGIRVIESRITEMEPNDKFIDRMQLKQKASADRAIAKEQRVQEEEQRLLAIAKGEREVAERQAAAKVVQIEKTTNAETEKQLALTKAEKLLEQAEIEKKTAEIQLQKAKIEADTKRTLADAEAYQKEVILKADNALQQKLDAEIRIHEVWAGAYAKRQVPTTVFGGASGDTPTGGDSEAKTFMQLMTVDAAKRLSYERQIEKN